MPKTLKPKKVTQSELHVQRLAGLSASVAEWGPEAHGYELIVHDPGSDLGPDLRPSLFVLDVETDESDTPSFVGLALIDVREGRRRVHYFSTLSEDLRNLVNASQFIGHNVKADLHWLNGWGCKITGQQIYGDTMIMAYCQDTTEENYGLKILTKARIGWQYPTYRDLVGKGVKKITLDKQETNLVAAYCGMDAASTYELFKQAKSGPWLDYYQRIDLPVYKLLFDVERQGAYLDVDYVSRLNADLLESKRLLLAELVKVGGPEFNPASPKQVKENFFAKLGIKEDKTDVKVLKAYAHIPQIGTLLKFREVSKLASTYTTAFLALPSLPRVHARFNQVAVSAGAVEGTTGIRTGRLSSSDPNLQNIPTRTELGAKLRGAFCAPPGHVLLGADYSQIELRLLAHYSKEPTFVKAFMEGRDVHAETAIKVFGPAEGAELEKNRNAAKTINFGLLYGAGVAKLAYMTGRSEEEAEVFMEKYWRELPYIQAWIKSTQNNAYVKGGVTTMFGRFIPLRGLKSLDKFERWYSERAAVNYVIQGSAAEVMKIAMLRLQKLGLIPVLTVHDELVFEVENKPDLIQATKELVERTMSNVVELRVPLTVEAGVGQTWKETKK
ncbi:MAG: DNA polymerase [Nitrospiraceae bacterium]